MTRSTNTRRIATVAMPLAFAAVATLAMVGRPAELAAQQANSSAAAFGMGNNYTASARGFDAVAWNPALLGLPGNPKFSIGGLALGSSAGVGPVTVNDIAEYAGATIPRSVRQDWVSRVRADGTQDGSFDAGMALIAVSYGKFAGSVSASGGGSMDMNGDALEMILLGNADAVASNRTLLPRGGGNGSGFVTTAASWGTGLKWKPTGKADEHVSVGVTGKWVMGLGYADGGSTASSISSSALSLRLPVVTASGSGAGSGVGIDLGAAWHAGNTTLSLAAMNVLNTFGWSADAFSCSDITADITADDITTNTDEVDCGLASVKPRVDAATNLSLAPALRAGLAWTGKKDLTITADVQSQLGGDDSSIHIGPKFSAGVGAEYTKIKYLPLRAGVGVITGGTQFSAGAGLRFGRFELGAGAQLRSADGVSTTNLMFGLGLR